MPEEDLRPPKVSVGGGDQDPAARRALLPAIVGTALLALVAAGVGWFAVTAGQASLDDELFQAMGRKDSAAALAALRRGANPSARDAPHPTLALTQWVGSAQGAGRRRRGMRSFGAAVNRWQVRDTAASALVTSVTHGLRPVTDDLLRRGAKVGVDEAVILADASRLARLKAGGADLNRAGQQHMTPLGRAVWRRDRKTVAWLLKNGAGPDVPTSFPAGGGQTYRPLTLAAWRGDLALAQTLVQAGAKLNHPQDQKPPLSDALAFGHPRVARYLLQQGADVTQGKPVLSACLSVDGKSWGLLREVIQAGGDPNEAFGSGGETCLHLLIWNVTLEKTPQEDLQEPIETLLTHGADPNLTNKKAGSPLLAACSQGATHLAHMLLDHGADPAVSARGETCGTLLKNANGADADAVDDLIARLGTVSSSP